MLDWKGHTNQAGRVPVSPPVVLCGPTQLMLQGHWSGFLCPEALGQAQCPFSRYPLGPHPVPSEQGSDWCVAS